MTAAEALEGAGLLTPEVRVLFHPIRPERLLLWPAPRWMMRIWGKGISGLTFTRLVFIDPNVLDGDPRRLGLLVIHELTHVRQWMDGGLLGFSLPYFKEYIGGRATGLGHREAYLRISFEREAREMADHFRRG